MLKPRRPCGLALSPDQIASYRENGYLTIDQFADPEELARLRRIFAKLFAERAGRDRGYHLDLVGIDEDDSPPLIPQILHPSRLVPELRRAQFLARAEIVARQLFGPDVEFLIDHALLKPAHGEESTPWHQDAAFGDPRYDSEAVSFWLPLQEATIANGCLHFIPRSHLGEVLPHRPAKADPRLHGLECVEGFDPIEAVACPFPAGGVSLHDGMTLHSAGPNRSDRPRFAYVLIFGIRGRRRTIPRQFPWQERSSTARQKREQQWIARTGRMGALARWLDFKIQRLTSKFRALHRAITVGLTRA